MSNVFWVRFCATATDAGKTIANRNKIVVRIRVLFFHRYSTFRKPARQPGRTFDDSLKGGGKDCLMVGDQQTSYIVVPYGAGLRAELNGRCKSGLIECHWSASPRR